HGRGAGVGLRRALAVLGMVGALALTGCGGGRRDQGDSRLASAAPVAGAEPHHLARPSAAVMQLRAALSRALAKSGSHVGVSVYDLTAHEPLFELRDGVGRPPASVEKLYTTVAVLQKLGGDVRLHTTVFGSGHLGPGGVWHGNLYLRGRGDPTFGDGS